jgi:hypothetical protein
VAVVDPCFLHGRLCVVRGVIPRVSARDCSITRRYISCRSKCSPEGGGSWHARRRAMAIVSSAMYSGVAELEDDINRAAPESETASGDTSFDAGRSNGRSWLTKAWHAIAGRWAQGRREREIKKAFAAVVEADRRASRNFGIPHRSPIDGGREVPP